MIPCRGDSTDLHWRQAPTSGPQTYGDGAWVDLTHGLRRFIEEPTPHPPGCDLPRGEWVLLNRLRSGHGRFAAFLHKIGLASNDACKCGRPQTSDHVLDCPAIGLRGNLATVDSDFRSWLRQTDLAL